MPKLPTFDAWFGHRLPDGMQDDDGDAAQRLAQADTLLRDIG